MKDKEDTIQQFREFFFQDAWNAIPLAYEDLIKPFESDYQLYQDSEKEKLECIDSTLRELREDLVESPFKASFSLNVVKDNLFAELEDFCISWPSFESEDHESVGFDGYDNNLFARIYSKKYNYKELFSYVIVEHIKTLVLHIALYQIYIELKKRKAEILEKSAMAPSTAFADTSFIETPVEEINTSYSTDCQRIFKDPDARMIFEYLQVNLVSEKTELADYSFVFRRMQRDGYIREVIKEKTFRDFIHRHFYIYLNSRLKPEGYSITDLKEKMYVQAIRSGK